MKIITSKIKILKFLLNFNAKLFVLYFVKKKQKKNLKLKQICKNQGKKLLLRSKTRNSVCSSTITALKIFENLIKINET